MFFEATKLVLKEDSNELAEVYIQINGGPLEVTGRVVVSTQPGSANGIFLSVH